MTKLPWKELARRLYRQKRLLEKKLEEKTKPCVGCAEPLGSKFYQDGWFVKAGERRKGDLCVACRLKYPAI